MQTDQLSLTFAALADPTRRSIVTRLAEGDATVNELAEPFPVSLPAISPPEGARASRPDRPQPRCSVAAEPPRGRPAGRRGRMDAVAQADVGGTDGSTRNAPAQERRAG